MYTILLMGGLLSSRTTLEIIPVQDTGSRTTADPLCGLRGRRSRVLSSPGLGDQQLKYLSLSYVVRSTPAIPNLPHPLNITYAATMLAY